MIHIIIGTKAQLIKVAPLMRELQDRNIGYNFIISGQHRETMDDLRTNFGLKAPDTILYDGPDIVRVDQMFFWSVKMIFKVLLDKKKIFKNDKHGIVLNHGDTLTTLLGSILAKISGLKNGHLESGLRSFNFLHPFPEELIRYITFALTDIYFCPGPWALENLKKYKGQKIDTSHNTLLDSVRLAVNSNAPSIVNIPDKEFAIVSLHRYENIFKKKHFLTLIEIVESVGKKIKVLFILHPPTKNQLIEFDFYKRLAENINIELRPRYDYFDFIKLLARAEFIITDGGSNQEESFYLGKPCILLRKKTERIEGLNSNVILSGYDTQKIDDFTNNYQNYEQDYKLNCPSPSKIIADHLLKYI